MQQTYVLNPRKIAILLITIALCLSIISIISEYLLFVVFADSESNTLVILDLFSVNIENSIPTWYATILLLTASVILALIAHAKWSARAPYRWHWAGLALVFLYLSIDEGAGIHEYMADFLFDAFQTTGYLYFAWQIVAVPLVVIFGLLYIPFLFALPPFTRYGFIISGAIYTGGALFIEGISANYLYSQDGVYDFTYLSIATVEETFEMIGAITFIAVLMLYMRQLGARFVLASTADVVNYETITPPIPVLDNVSESDDDNSSAFDGLENLYRRIQQSGMFPYLIVLLSGINLILIQWVLVRELTTVLRGTELVILLVTVSYFVGLSIGYRVADRVPRHWLKPLGSVVLLLHISLPIWFRLVVVGLDKIDAYGIAFLILPILVPFIVSAFYSIFLPLFVDNGDGKLTYLYAVEVSGSAIGVLCLVFFTELGLITIFVIYAVMLLGILAMLGMPRLWWMRLAVITLGWLWFFPALNHWSNTLWFQQIQDLPTGSRTLLTAYSPYQKVDVIEDTAGNRYLFLNSMEHFGSPAGIWLNIIMGRVPAILLQPENAVAFGGGAMQLEAMIADYADHVTTVEIDPIVVDASRRLFTAYNAIDTLENRSIVIDDARHFIANTDEQYDLIVSALPAAFTIQTGALYSVPFIEDARAQLTPDGVFVMNLTGQFTPDNPIPKRIAASLLATFDDVMIVTSNTIGLSFAYASDNMPFNADNVRTFIEANGEYDYAILETDTVRAIVGDAPPITLDALDFVLQTSINRIETLIGWHDE